MIKQAKLSLLLVSPRVIERQRSKWACSRCLRCLSTQQPLRAARRAPDLNSGFTASYDPTTDPARGPMFNKSSFGIPQFYPRDLKQRLDEYVVGQDRAKKTICSTIFNHYQNLRRRHQHQLDERNRQEKIMRQKFAREREVHQRRRESHPLEGNAILCSERNVGENL